MQKSAQGKEVSHLAGFLGQTAHYCVSILSA